MKQIKFADDKRSGFYTINIKDNIFITSFGHSHLFNYPSVLVKELGKLSEKINKDKINVYFDLSSVLGNNADNKYFVITYSKTKKDFIYPSKNTLIDLPCRDCDDIGENLKSPHSRFLRTAVKANRKRINDIDDIVIHRKHTTARDNKKASKHYSKGKRVT